MKKCNHPQYIKKISSISQNEYIFYKNKDHYNEALTLRLNTVRMIRRIIRLIIQYYITWQWGKK